MGIRTNPTKFRSYCVGFCVIHPGNPGTFFVQIGTVLMKCITAGMIQLCCTFHNFHTFNYQSQLFFIVEKVDSMDSVVIPFNIGSSFNVGRVG